MSVVKWSSLDLGGPMAENRGVAPPNMTTPVGRVRGLVGDTEFGPLSPPEAGFGSYAMFSDSEIEAFLASSGGSVEGAVYFGYLQLASAAALESKAVQDFDLRIDLTKRASDLRAIAQMWKDQWDSTASDIFEIFDTGTQSCRCIPELSAREVCRSSCGVFVF